MKRILCLALALITVFAFAACSSGNAVVDDVTPIKAAKVLKVGMECDYAPFNWLQQSATDRTVPVTSGGYADGYDVQIAKIIAEKLGVELQITPYVWDGLVPALQAGTIDCIIAGMSPTAERKLTIDFSDVYYESTLVMVVKKGSKWESAKALSDFAGAKITGQINTYHYDVIDQITGVDKQTALKTFPNMIIALQAGTIDGYVSELPGAVSAAAANSDLTYVVFDEGKGFVTSADDTAIAVGVRKNSNLTSEINKILAEITSAQREEIMNAAVANQPAISE